MYTNTHFFSGCFDGRLPEKRQEKEERTKNTIFFKEKERKKEGRSIIGTTWFYAYKKTNQFYYLNSKLRVYHKILKKENGVCFKKKKKKYFIFILAVSEKYIYIYY